MTRPRRLIAAYALAIVAGGLTFNLASIALPKVVDEGLGHGLTLSLTGAIATAVFLVGALTQVAMGRLIDRVSLPVLFAGLSALQPIGLGLAALTTGLPLLAGLVLAMAAIYGQVVLNDAMVARYVPDAYRARAYSVRYFIGFTASGFVVPLIGVLHDRGGFSLVLGLAALCGLAIWGAALAFYGLTRPPAGALAPAE